jgi:hypothetical protein
VRFAKIWLIVVTTIFHLLSVFSNLAMLILINMFAFIEYNKCTIQDILENSKIDSDSNYYCNDVLKFGNLIMGLINFIVSILFCRFLFKLTFIAYKNRKNKRLNVS